MSFTEKLHRGSSTRSITHCGTEDSGDCTELHVAASSAHPFVTISVSPQSSVLHVEQQDKQWIWSIMSR